MLGSRFRCCCNPITSKQQVFMWLIKLAPLSARLLLWVRRDPAISGHGFFREYSIRFRPFAPLRTTTSYALALPYPLATSLAITSSCSAPSTHPPANAILADIVPWITSSAPRTVETPLPNSLMRPEYSSAHYPRDQTLLSRGKSVAGRSVDALRPAL